MTFSTGFRRSDLDGLTIVKNGEIVRFPNWTPITITENPVATVKTPQKGYWKLYYPGDAYYEGQVLYKKELWPINFPAIRCIGIIAQGDIKNKQLINFPATITHKIDSFKTGDMIKGQVLVKGGYQNLICPLVSMTKFVTSTILIVT